ncbi:MAG: TolC family protein [Myxococcales bacterium]
MDNVRKLGLLLAVAGLSFAARAQEQQPRQPGAIAPPARMRVGPQRRQVSLREALQMTVKQGPDIAAARAQAAIVQAGVRRAWTTWQPDITATGTFDHTNAPSSVNVGPPIGNVTLVAPNSRYGTFQISQPFLTPQGLFLPGIANANAEAADRGADETREQILLGTSRTYLVLQGLEGLLEAAREAEKVALRREQDARARIAAGTEVEIALLRAQTETAQARVQIANREGQKETLLPLLEALTGEAIEPLPAKVYDLPPLGEESAQPWENAYSVRSAIAFATAAQKSVRLDQFLWLPSVSGAFRENYTSNGGFADKNWTNDLLLNISIPLYDRGLRYAQLAEDRARLAEAQAQLAVVRARARSNWLGARANLLSTAAVVQQTESQEQLATRTQVQVDASYRAGISTSLDLSAADQTRFEAQSAVAQARAELEIRKAELAAAEGRLYELSR